MTTYTRQCQECFRRQKAKDPDTYKDAEKEAWRDVKCKMCGSDALDYGSEAYELLNGKWEDTRDEEI